jgi:hypothetical protein
MTEARYRALPVDLVETNVDVVATAFGDVAITGALVAEAREYSGGEFAVVLEPSDTSWKLADTVVERVELWLYGTKRMAVAGEGDFLERPSRLRRLVLGDAVDIRFDGGSITGAATHAVLRVQII